MSLPREPIYADYAATTPCDSRVLKRMAEVMTSGWGNPSNLQSSYGRRAKRHIDEARLRVSQLLGATEDEILFTSGATEACNMAIKGIAAANPARQLIIAPTEHPAVIESAKIVERAGIAVHWLKVDQDGVIIWKDLEKALEKPSSAIAAMLVNNQTGLIMPQQELRDHCRQHNVLWISDITQALPRMHLNVHELGIDIAMCSAHKLYGPQGVGALFVKRGLHIQPFMDGGGQESQRRSGTENVAGIVGFGEAATLQRLEENQRLQKLKQLSTFLEHEISSLDSSRVIFSEDQDRAPGITYVAFPDAAPQIIRRIQGIMVSPGSSCASMHASPSEALLAMGVTKSMAANAVRISISHQQNEDDMRTIARAICSDY